MTKDRVQWLRDLEVNTKQENQQLETFIKNAFEQLMIVYNLVIDFDITAIKIFKCAPDYTSISFDVVADEDRLNQIYDTYTKLSSNNNLFTLNIYGRYFIATFERKFDTTLSIQLVDTNIDLGN